MFKETFHRDAEDMGDPFNAELRKMERRDGQLVITKNGRKVARVITEREFRRIFGPLSWTAEESIQRSLNDSRPPTPWKVVEKRLKTLQKSIRAKSRKRAS